jgi:hypothetical protein
MGKAHVLLCCLLALLLAVPSQAWSWPAVRGAFVGFLIALLLLRVPYCLLPGLTDDMHSSRSSEQITHSSNRLKQH